MKILGLLAAVIALAAVSSAAAAPQALIAKKCKAGYGVRYKHNNYNKPYCKHIVKSATADTAEYDVNGKCAVNGTVKTYKGEYSLTVSAEAKSNGKDVTYPLTTISPKATKTFKPYALVIPEDLHLTGPTIQARFIVEGKKTNWVTCAQPPAGT